MSDLYSQAIHGWFHEKYPDPDTGAYLNFDEVITIISDPNVKVFYKEELVRMNCWITYGSAQPLEFVALYSDPKMFEKLEKVLEHWAWLEQECKDSLGKAWKEGRHDWFHTLPAGVLD